MTTTALGLDLLAAGWLPELPAAYLEGRERDLLAPLSFLPPGERPPGPPPPADRRELAAALTVANRAYGHPAADRLGASLADPATRVVVVGQQPGLFGGPLYTLSKAVAAARWAAELAAAGEPAVAVFWVATEDHDFAEISRAAVLTADGPRRFDLGDDPEPLAPVGSRTLGPRVEAVLEEVAALPAGGERWAEWWREVGRWYRPDARFGEAFCRLLVALLGERCPLLADAMLPAVKEAERPWLEALVAKRREVDEAAAAADREIAARGFRLQVAPQPGASPLFLLDGGERRRIEWSGEDGWALRGRDGSGGRVDELAARLRDNPIVASPGVLARPAVQDAIFGTALLVLGPGELAYLAQAAPLYRVLGVAPPAVALRPQLLVVEEHQLAKLEQVGLELADLLAEEARLDRLLARRAGADLGAPLKARLEREFEALKGPALALDPNLERPWEKTREQVLRAAGAFTDRLAAAAARADDVQRQRVERLRGAFLPGGSPQERVVSSAHFPGKYGERFVDSLLAQLDVGDPGRLQAVVV